MKKQTKVIALFILVLACMPALIGCIPNNPDPTVPDESKETEANFTLVLNSDGNSYTIKKYTGSKTEVTVPKTYKNLPVTAVGDGAFYNCDSLTSVIIPDSVISIGSQAFYVCSNLTSVTMGSSVTVIGEGAFAGCRSLTGLTIPDSVTTISDSMFVGCTGLTSVTFGESVTTIGPLAFYGCTGLTEIIIPDSVTTIGKEAFEYCSGLTSVTFENPNGWYVTKKSFATSGTDLDLTDPAKNAEYLTATYSEYYWKRK